MVAKPQQMAENQLQPIDANCRFCGSDKRIPIVTLQENPQVWLLACRRCHAASASRIPKDKALENYYQNYYENKLDARVTFDGIERFATHLFSQIVKHLKKPRLKIADFGGGDGSIAMRTSYKLLTAGIQSIDISIIDYNEKLAPIDNKNISLSHSKSLKDLPIGEYDLVLASAIIEHLPRPKETLIRLIKLLNDGGIFYARTPYVIPFIKLNKIWGKNWEFFYPMHLHDLGPDFWDTFFHKMDLDAHLRIIKSKPSIVQASFKKNFMKAFASYVFKAPWYLIGNRYRLVGGWEIFLEKQSR